MFSLLSLVSSNLCFIASSKLIAPPACSCCIGTSLVDMILLLGLISKNSMRRLFYFVLLFFGLDPDASSLKDPTFSNIGNFWTWFCRDYSYIWSLIFRRKLVASSSSTCPSSLPLSSASSLSRQEESLPRNASYYHIIESHESSINWIFFFFKGRFVARGHHSSSIILVSKNCLVAAINNLFSFFELLFVESNGRHTLGLHYLFPFVSLFVKPVQQFLPVVRIGQQ